MKRSVGIPSPISSKITALNQPRSVEQEPVGQRFLNSPGTPSPRLGRLLDCYGPKAALVFAILLSKNNNLNCSPIQPHRNPRSSLTIDLGKPSNRAKRLLYPLPIQDCARERSGAVTSEARLLRDINGKIGADERTATDHPCVVRTRVGVVDGRLYLFHVRFPACRPQGTE